MIERCESCKEQIVVVNGSKKHRYNLSVFCPNGKTLIPIGQRSDKPHEKYDYPYIAEAEMEADADADADADAKVDAKAESESEPESESEEESDTEKEAEANEETEEDMKKQDAKPSKGKGKDQGKPSPPSDPQDGEDKSDSQQSPPPTSDDWALPAAEAINKFWAERIQTRGYRPTDEELAKVMLEHSKGKVSYSPAPEPTKPVEPLPFLPNVTDRICEFMLAAQDLHMHWSKYGGTDVEVGHKQRLQKLLKEFVQCVHCGGTNPQQVCPGNSNHTWHVRLNSPVFEPSIGREAVPLMPRAPQKMIKTKKGWIYENV